MSDYLWAPGVLQHTLSTALSCSISTHMDTYAAQTLQYHLARLPRVNKFDGENLMWILL